MRWRRVFESEAWPSASNAPSVSANVTMVPTLGSRVANSGKNLSMDDVPTLLDEFEERAGKNDAGAMLYAGA